MPMIEIRICSHKQLFEERKKYDDIDISAILVSSDQIDDLDYNWIPRRLILEFFDTIIDRANAFQPDQAKLVAAFVNQIPDETILFFCCDAGISRSAALAAAYLRKCGRIKIKEELKIWSNPELHPNSLVYSLQCEAFDIHVTQRELKKRIKINENAFSKRIGKSR